MKLPVRTDSAHPEWHAVDLPVLHRVLATTIEGLDADTAARRLAEHGPNSLPAGPGRPAWKRLLSQFHNVLNYVLMTAAGVTALMGEYTDAAVITAVVLVNAVIGYIQEGKAERAMEAIGRMLPLTARVRRDGTWMTLPAEELVPGDLIELHAGDRVPADARLVLTRDLEAEEAALTGESLPVAKQTEALPADTTLADRSCMVFSGTLVTRGQGTGLVCATGSGTELGRISGMLKDVRHLATPLLRNINRFARWLTLIIMVLAATAILCGYFVHDMPLAEGFLAGVALAVAAIPEGLPAIITITLAVGVQRMAVRRAIIRRLPAVETLGSVGVICSDKTGTLTRNELTVRHLVIDGCIHDDNDDARARADVRTLFEAGVLCNDAEPDVPGGDPLERALLEAASRAGLDVSRMRQEHPRLDLIPFSPESRYMATLHGDRICVKGAPETLLSYCSHQRSGTGNKPLDEAAWHRLLQEEAAAGRRMLALAEKRTLPDGESLVDGHIVEGLCLLGLVAFEDPPRPEARRALRACREAGITVKMITGDHAATAGAIAGQIGLDGGRVLTGSDLDAMDDNQLAETAETVNIYARTSPEHKLRLVSVLQARGRVVAMTGDGANDAPALKRADIGVAMGIKGTEAARRAADMVLADDNFATIVSGVEQGRGVYDNIRKTLLFILPTGAAEALVVLLAVALGLTLPITPLQILWINMVTAVTLGLALAFEPVEDDIMRRPPRAPSESLITPFMGIRLLWFSLILAAAFYALFAWVIGASGDQTLARTVALNAMVAGEMVYLFNCRQWLAPSLTRRALTANGWAWLSVAALIVLQAGVTYLPAARSIFETAPLAPGHWLAIAGFAAILILLVEGEKWLYRIAGRAGVFSRTNL